MIPSGLVIIFVEPASPTATNKLAPYVTLDQLFGEANTDVRPVHEIPSVLVMTLLALVEDAYPTATKRLFAYTTLFHEIADDALLAVHVIPSGLVITRLVPELATATNKLFPNATPFQLLSSVEDREVQVTPS